MTNIYETCDKISSVALNDVLNIIRGKWEIPVVGLLLDKSMRFNEIKQHLKKITPRQLTITLNNLELNGIIEKSLLSDFQEIYEYKLTQSGIDLKSLILEMVRWGNNHREKQLK